VTALKIEKNSNLHFKKIFKIISLTIFGGTTQSVNGAIGFGQMIRSVTFAAAQK
jgi:hypothetical protein